MGWLEELLSGPLEWSALHGIAEIRTFLAKVATRTDATRNELTVRVNGIRPMISDVPGKRFPYNIGKQLIDSSAVTVNVLTTPPASRAIGDWLFRDNSFTSLDAMERLHRPVVQLAQQALRNDAGNVIDLGCGNGVLVTRICEGRAGLVPYGVEIREAAFAHVRDVCPAFAANFSRGDMFSLDTLPRGHRFVLAILMVGRLLEVPVDRAERLRHWLAAQASSVLVYMYPGWSSESLKTLVERAGFQWLEGHDNATQALVRVTGHDSHFAVMNTS